MCHRRFSAPPFKNSDGFGENRRIIQGQPFFKCKKKDKRRENRLRAEPICQLHRVKKCGGEGLTEVTRWVLNEKKKKKRGLEVLLEQIHM